LIDFHKTHKGLGTIYLTKVENPSKYGVVLTDGIGRVEKFIEKPQNFISDRINAGIYLFSTKIIDRISVIFKHLYFT